MTVVNMLSFGDSGAAITDEQASSYVRKLNVANKLRVINNFVFGGSGIMDFLEKTYDQLRTVLPEKCDFNELSKHLSKSTISFINNYKDSCIQANYNISLSEFQAGKTKEGSPLDLEFKKPIADYFNQLNKEIVYPNSILVGGINGEKFEIYYFYFGNCSFIRSSTPYASIGSGSDEAGRILSRKKKKK
ncbi:hypothetical protein HZC32_01695, partial [Candidatus Woesearchaeota archaeon]|nr:hypothetical protein [Candidatus Woesearchaeota archaeon]